MRFEIAFISAAIGFAAGQTLNIPTRVGSIVSLAAPSVISGSKDMGNKEYDRGRPCDTDADTGSDSAVFILENGATLSNVIIGVNQLEGIHFAEMECRFIPTDTLRCALQGSLHAQERMVPRRLRG